MALKAAAGPTRESFDLLLARLDPDRERAGERYEAVRAKLIRFFDYRGCAPAEQAADETINRVARRLAEGEAIRSEDASRYFLGVARNVLREYWARPEGGWRALDEVAPGELAAPAQAPVEDGDDRRWRCLERCLGALAAAQRELVLGYYEWGRRERIGSRRELCRRLGLSLNAVRIRAHRIRAALERCVRSCAEAEATEMESASFAHKNGDGHRG